MKIKKQVEDFSGAKFGNWTVIEYEGWDKRHLWKVVCECGNEGIVGDYQLRKGLSKSCGCLVKKVNSDLHVSHGESSNGKRTPEYRAYLLAKAQCTNPKHENFEKFGGRGVKFLFKDFADFLQSVGRKPDRKSVLTRIDKTGNYIMGNVEWTLNKNRKLFKG